MNEYITILIPIIIGIVFGGFVIPRMMLVSIKDNWGEKPDEMEPKSYKAIQVAGLSLYPLILITLCLSLMIPIFYNDNEVVQDVMRMMPRTLQLVTGMALLYIVGLKYDMHGSSSFIRLMAIITASCLFPASNMMLTNLHGLFGINEISTMCAVPLTITVAIFIVEMFKLLDGMDGLASSFGVIILLMLVGLSCQSEGRTPVVVAASTFGVVISYWCMKFFNKKWDKTFMGNSGSYVLGYIIAYLVIVIANRAGNGYMPGAHLLVLSIILLPVADIIRVVGSRARDGRSIITPDRNQLNHLLLRTGMNKRVVFPLIMLLPVLQTAATYAMIKVSLGQNLIVVINVLVVIAIEMTIAYFVRNRQVKMHLGEWEKVYGEDAWNANVPIEVLKTKQKVFGDLNLPDHMKDESKYDFIPDGMSAFERGAKRLFDIFVSTFCLIVFSPLFLLSYILIKLDDGGPAIYKQERLGRFGRPFYIYKYRSMRLDAEKMGPQLSHAGGDDDPRLTKIGRFLRAHHLDELPQIWNVFRGDMSFIGYRPERKFFIDQIMEHDPRYAFLYQIRPGVTSYATLYNGYTDTMEKMLRRLELDLYYLGHRSFWLDCKTLFLTFASIVFGKKF